jgi:eukaryotic-like serine/threonine-protein kinase
LERRDGRSHSPSSASNASAAKPLRVFDGGLTATPAPLQAGPSRTIGRYALYAEIASGGMAAIHIGRLMGPVGFARTVAIKRLHPPLAKDPEFVAMFLDEARLAARIRHPNVVSTLDVVATEGELFVVMEYVQGESLARLLRAVRTNNELVPAPVAASIIVGVLHGLHAAHEARDERGEPLRIVHRDVSPHNILVGTDGAAHVIDFGVAKARGRVQITQQGQIKGKLSYMPSEQLLGNGLDHRADIFAATIVFWEALTGQRLFQGVDDGEIYAKVLLGNIEPPSKYAPGLAPAVDAIVLKGLARDREQRYATARDMALAIESAMPLATPSQIGSWVEGLVGDSLAERTEQIADIERDDLSDAGAPAAALLAVGPGTPLSGFLPRDPNGPTSGTARKAARADQTALTKQHGARAKTTTGPTSPMNVLSPGAQALVADAAPEDSLSAVAGSPRRLSTRAILVAVAAIIAVGLVVASRWTASGPAVAVTGGDPNVAAAHSAAPPPSSTAPTSSGWIPVMPLPGADNDPGINAATLPEATASGGGAQGQGPATPQGKRAAGGLAPTRPAAAPGANPPSAKANSCDPPFWIDADGTKRYYRHCVSP